MADKSGNPNKTSSPTKLGDPNKDERRQGFGYKKAPISQQSDLGYKLPSSRTPNATGSAPIPTRSPASSPELNRARAKALLRYVPKK